MKTSNFKNDLKFNQHFVIEYEGEVNIAELTLGLPYICQNLKLEEDWKRFFNAKYSFDVSKSDKIFDNLVKDRQIVLSKGDKFLPIKQRKCKKYF